MRTDNALRHPEWPTEVVAPTRDEAILAALEMMEPGDVFWLHHNDCALMFEDSGAACDCAVMLVPFPTAIH